LIGMDFVSLMRGSSICFAVQGAHHGGVMHWICTIARRLGVPAGCSKRRELMKRRIVA
jgi:hypothetical protein